MRLLQTKLWALLLAGAFLILWCLSIGVTMAAPQDLPTETAQAAAMGSTTQAIGIAGWCLVGLGFLGVGITALIGGRPRRRRPMTRASAAPRRPQRMVRYTYGGYAAYNNRRYSKTYRKRSY